MLHATAPKRANAGLYNETMCTRAVLGIVLVLIGNACGAPKPGPATIKAPAAFVSPLAPTELVTVTTTAASLTCEPNILKSLKQLASTVVAVAACKPALESLNAVLLDNCASLDSELTGLRDKLNDCQKAYVAENAMKAAGPPDTLAFKRASDNLAGLAVPQPGTTSSSTGVPFEAFAFNAVTDFVVARAKAEILGWVADEFGQALCKERDDDGFDVRSYFPSTCRIFLKGTGQIDAGLQDFGRSLQAAIQRDLRDAVGRLVNRALVHVDPKLRVLLAFSARFVETRTLSNAAGYADQQTPCEKDRAVCAIKIGLYVVAAPDLSTFDPKQAGAFLATLGKTIAASPDPALRVTWEAWTAKREIATAVIEQLKQARSALEQALTMPSMDTIFAVDTALKALVQTIGNGGLFDGALQQQIREAAARLTVSRDWLELAIIGYQVLDGMRRGDDPLGLLVAAGRASRCQRERDVICAIKVGILIVDAIGDTSAWNKVDLADLAAVDAFATRAALTFDTKLTAQTDGTAAWIAAKLTLTPDDKLVLIKSVLRQVRRVADVVRTAYTTKRDGEPFTQDQLRDKARELLEATRSLFAVASTLTDRFAKATSSSHVAKAERLIEDLFAAWNALAEGDAGQFVVSLAAIADALDVANPLPGSIRRYLPLVTAIASAKDSAEMKAALDKYAAPVGGYKEKRARPWMASVTAFVGGAAGWEKLDDPTHVDTSAHGHAGMFAPIGIDVACGKGHWCNGFGVVLSVFDLGNLVSIRLDDLKAPDPTFRQVFSPGVYARYNVFGPMSLGFGVAGVPELRRPETGTMTEAEPAGGFKAVVFVAADVTVFPF